MRRAKYYDIVVSCDDIKSIVCRLCVACVSRMCRECVADMLMIVRLSVACCICATHVCRSCVASVSHPCRTYIDPTNATTPQQNKQWWITYHVCKTLQQRHSLNTQKHSHGPRTCMLHARANHVMTLTMQLLTRQCATASNNTMHMCFMPKPQPTDPKLMSQHPQQNQQQVMYHCVVNPNNYITRWAHNNIHMGPNKPACGTHTNFNLCFTQCNHCDFISQS